VEERDYQEIKDRVAERLLRIPGVHMIAVGAKQVDGERTGDVAITLFVERKRPLSEIPSGERIPEEIEGVKTDVIEMPPPTIGQTGPGQLFGANRDDDGEYRPVRGGSQIARTNANTIGTLGCLCTVRGDPNTVIALTNHHVIYENCSDSPNHEEVGQPNGSTSSSDCCSDIIGTVLDAQCDQEVDITLVKLNRGAEWLAEIQEVGRVTATHDITPAEVNPLATPPITYPVKKRGRRTGLTGGVVTHAGAVGQVQNHDGTVHRSYNNAMIIDPNPDPASPGTHTDFHLPGDSGSALLNEFDMVVGITFGQAPATATTSGVGVAFPIKALIDKFAEGVLVGRRIELRVATADRAGDVHTVPTAMVADGQPALPPITPAQAERLEEEIRTTRRGARYSDLARRHREEVGALIHSNRRVTVVWHRSGAAELVQWLVRAFSTPGVRVPAEIQGRPARACLDDLAAALRRNGSAELAADVDTVMPTLPDVAGLTRRDIVDRLKGPAHSTAPAPA
jgi:hypothetical protein